MTLGTILKTAVKVAQQIPTAIALASCVVGIGEDVIRGATTDPADLEEDAPALQKQVAHIVATLRRLRREVWPMGSDFDFDFDADDEEIVDVVPTNIVPINGVPEPCG